MREIKKKPRAIKMDVNNVRIMKIFKITSCGGAHL